MGSNLIKDEIIEDFDQILLYYVCQKLNEVETTTYGLMPPPEETLPMKLIMLICRQLDQSYRSEFGDMVENLKIGNNELSHETLNVVFENLFNNQVKFTYISCMVYFAGEIIVHYARNKMEKQCVRNILNWIHDYFVEYCMQFMLMYGGWNGFVNFYTKDW